jgi:2-aminoethylphosphonate-pyruvate transaminase
MAALGFSQFVADEHDGHIITSFKYPKDKKFNFEEFYNRLSEKGSNYWDSYNNCFTYIFYKK